jgi:hypothetical protein
MALGTLAIFPFLALFSLIHRDQTCHDTIMRIAAPPLRWQLESIYASPTSQTHSDNRRSYISYDNDEETTPILSLPNLMLVHLFSPLISIGVVLSAWVAGFFWFYAGIIGNPEGAGAEQQRTNVRYLEEKDGENDGRASVLTVRNWWKGWLTKAVVYVMDESDEQ